MRRQCFVLALSAFALVAGAVRCGAPGAAAGGASAPAASPGPTPPPNASGATPAVTPAPGLSPATGAPPPARSSTTGPATGNATAAAEIPPAPRFASTVFAMKSDPALRACAASVHTGRKDPAANVAATGAACAKAARMKPAAKTVTGDQSDAQAPQSFPFRAQANHCYRVYAQAAAGLQDFTLALRDSAGA